MNFAKQSRRATQMVMLILTTIIGVAPIAHAQGGVWSVSYRVNGEAQGQYRDGQNTNQTNVSPWRNPSNNTNMFQSNIPFSGTFPFGASANSYSNSSGSYNSVSARAEGTISILFDWRRANPLSSAPLPPPPKILSFVVRASMRAEGGGQSPVTLEATTGMQGETVVTTGPTQFSGNPPRDYSSRTASVMLPVVLETQSQTHIEWTSPNLFAKVSIATYVPSQTMSGAQGNGAAFPEEFKQEPFAVTSPNPNGLALAPCPDPTPQPPLNQYVITNGVPVQISYGGTNASFLQQLKDNLTWSLSGPSPELKPVSRVNAVSNNSNNSILQPEHETTQRDLSGNPIGPITYQAGLQFRLYEPPPSGEFPAFNGFPTSNDQFGAKTLTHTFKGQTLATSPLALFYPATGTQHPYGGPKGYYYGALGTWAEIDTPNFIYYYDKAWKNPFGVEVRYWGENYSQYSRNDPFIYTGTDSHGLSGAGSNGGSDADGGIDTDLFAQLPDTEELVWAGQQKIRGLDLYARNIYHECVHKKLYEAISGGGVDTDNDGLPDSIENDIGTDPIAPGSSVPGWSYGGYADQEAFARMCERDLPVPDEDWADDGFNFGRLSPPNRCQRVVESIWPGYTKNSLIWVDARSLIS